MRCPSASVPHHEEAEAQGGGLVVYVMSLSPPLVEYWRVRASYIGHQLRTSRRFDTIGLERDQAELFLSFPRRCSSSSTSVSSASDHILSRLQGELQKVVRLVPSHILSPER